MNDTPAAASSGPSGVLSPAGTPEHITRDIHRRFYDLPEEIKKRQEAERGRKRDRRNAKRLLHMKTVYWKKNKRLTVPFTLPEWERLTRFAKKQGQPPTTAFRQAAFDRIAETDPPAGDAGSASARRSSSPHLHDPVLQQNLNDLLCRTDCIAKAIERVGINIS